VEEQQVSKKRRIDFSIHQPACTLFRRASFFFASATAVEEDAGGIETSLTAARVARVKRVARANAPVRLSASETAQRAREKHVFLSCAST
jgi:hypothetical protein